MKTVAGPAIPAPDDGESLRPGERSMLRFLLSWLGVWPGAGLLRVAPSARRMLPDAQGLIRPLVGVISPHGAAVSVSPLAFGDVRRTAAAVGRPGAGLAAVLAELPAVLGMEHQQLEVRHMWWTTSPLKVSPSPGVTGANTRVDMLTHTPLGTELVLPPHFDRGCAGESLAQAANALVARGTVALFTAAAADRAAAEIAVETGFSGAPWQLLRLTAAPPRPARLPGGRSNSSL
jgi:hypothetical protein